MLAKLIGWFIVLCVFVTSVAFVVTVVYWLWLRYWLWVEKGDVVVWQRRRKFYWFGSKTEARWYLKPWFATVLQFRACEEIKPSIFVSMEPKDKEVHVYNIATQDRFMFSFKLQVRYQINDPVIAVLITQKNKKALEVILEESVSDVVREIINPKTKFDLFTDKPNISTLSAIEQSIIQQWNKTQQEELGVALVNARVSISNPHDLFFSRDPEAETKIQVDAEKQRIEMLREKGFTQEQILAVVYNNNKKD